MHEQHEHRIASLVDYIVSLQPRRSQIMLALVLVNQASLVAQSSWLRRQPLVPFCCESSRHATQACRMDCIFAHKIVRLPTLASVLANQAVSALRSACHTSVYKIVSLIVD